MGPEVLCEFSAGGRRLEVTRSPEWMRPVKRGTGTTREQASTSCAKSRTAAGWPCRHRNDEAASEIQGLLGMNMAQFTKVVLLAQGEFAAFLRADAKDRQELLQKLFGTEVYKDLENQLAATAREAQSGVAAGVAELAGLEQLARSQAAGLLPAAGTAAHWGSAGSADAVQMHDAGPGVARGRNPRARTCLPGWRPNWLPSWTRRTADARIRLANWPAGSRSCLRPRSA